MDKHLYTWTPAVIAVMAGSSYSFAAGLFGASFDLSSLNGANGFVINGVNELDYSGVALSAGGDVNADGVDDLIIAASLADPNGASKAGMSYVVFGGIGIGLNGVLELSSLDGTNGFVCNGIDANDRSGTSVSNAGDVNGDGIDDLIIAAPYADPNGQVEAGETYVIFGGAILGSSGTLELSALDGSNGFVCNGIDPGDRCGRSVSSAGDINGDGFGDLVIGANGADPNGQAGAGESYIVFGGNGVGSSGVLDLSALDGTTGFICNGVGSDDGSGRAVSAAGDVNGDGYDDLIIGAVGADPDGQSNAGATYVIFGGADVGSGGVLNLSALDGANGFVCNGIDQLDYSGFSVSSAGDLNGDGIDDLIIGAVFAEPNEENNPGQSYIVFGDHKIGNDGVLNLSDLDGMIGFVCNGITSGDFSGTSVSAAGDVNGDTIDDIIIGASGASPEGRLSAGGCSIVFGGPGVGTGVSLNLSSLDGDNGFSCNGIDAGDWSGNPVSFAGDINSDGIDDFIIGAVRAFPNEQRYAGESYVIFGRSPCQADLNADGAVDTADLGILIGEFGTLGPEADINGDGVVDTADLGQLIAAFGDTCGD